MAIIVDKTLEQCIHDCARHNARAAPGYDSILKSCFLVSVDLYGTCFLKTVYNSTTWPPIAGPWLHRRAGNGSAIVSWVGMDMHSILGLETMEEEEDEITILDGLVVIISGYHKTQWRIGTRPVARFLPPAVGNLLARYLIYVPSFLRFLYGCMQYTPCKGYLFSDEHGVWSPDRLGNYIKSHSSRLLGFQITTRIWRQIAIAIDRRMYAGRACKVYGVTQRWDRRALHAVDQSGLELDPDYHMHDGGDGNISTLLRARNFKASHTPATNQAVYGNDTTLMLGFTDALLAAYREVSQFWYRSIACIDSQ